MVDSWFTYSISLGWLLFLLLFLEAIIIYYTIFKQSRIWYRPATSEVFPFRLYNFIIMQGKFNINLPSIPGAVLKFKIQDVRVKGFLTKDARFKDNKQYLTKRFIDSFPNLLPKTESKEIQQDGNKSQLSTNLSSFFREDSGNFRWMMANEKKNLLIKFEDQYKNYCPPIYGENKYDKGYSFCKEGAKDTLDGEVKKYQSQIVGHQGQKSMDNYYFMQTEQSEESESDCQEETKRKRRQEKLAKKKRVQPSAAFKSEDRWEHNERLLKSKISPGPGYYKIESPRLQKVKEKKQEPNPQKAEPQISKLKELLKDFNTNKSLLSQANQQKNEKNEKDTKDKRHSSSFVQGNIDRFGNHKFPISSNIVTPGPGKYNTHGDLQEKAKRILILQQQRKLLKEWYNDQ